MHALNCYVFWFKILKILNTASLKNIAVSHNIMDSFEKRKLLMLTESEMQSTICKLSYDPNVFIKDVIRLKMKSLLRLRIYRLLILG